MIGNNEIVLNEATMIVALQHWFDTVTFATGKSPKVQSVKQDKSGGYSRQDCFTVAITEKEPAKT